MATLKYQFHVEGRRTTRWWCVGSTDEHINGQLCCCLLSDDNLLETQITLYGIS